MIIYKNENCGNSPKSLYITDYIVGMKDETLSKIYQGKALYIEEVITHGKYGVAIIRVETVEMINYALYFEFMSAGSLTIQNITLYEKVVL